MTDIDRAWNLLLAAFPRWFIQERTRAAWNELLADLDPRDTLAGARDLARACKYQQPSLAEWRERALASRRARFVASEQAAQRARAAEWMSMGAAPRSEAV